MTLRVLGVDSSLRNFGFALVDFDDGLVGPVVERLRLGVHVASDELSTSDRLGLHYRELRHWVVSALDEMPENTVARIGV